MTAPERKYLGVPAPKPRVGFFELTSCEGCQLQLLNNEAPPNHNKHHHPTSEIRQHVYLITSSFRCPGSDPCGTDAL